MSTITGIEDLTLNTLNSDTIILNGVDLQTSLSQLNTAITNSTSTFSLYCEFPNNWTQGGYFSWGASNDNNLGSVMPNCELIAYKIESENNVTSNTQIQITKNNISVIQNTILNGTTTTGFQTGLSVSFTLGDLIRVRCNNTISAGSGGVKFKASLIFQVGSTFAINGSNGTDGQSVSFNVPSLTTITPNNTASIIDIVTTNSNIQTHSLNFSLPRPVNNSFVVGTIASTTGDPSLTNTITTDANGDKINTLNFVLKQGIPGASITGPQGPPGDDATSTIASIAAAAASASSAGLSATYAAQSLASANASAASAASINNVYEARITSLENKTTYQSIGGSFPNGYTSFGGSGIKLYNPPVFAPSIEFLTNGKIDQTSQGSNNKFLNTDIYGNLIIKNSSNVNKISFDPNGTNTFINNNQFSGTLQTINDVYISKNNGIDNLIFANSTSGEIDISGNVLISGDLEINSNTLINGDLTASSNDILLGSTNDVNSTVEINNRNINIGTLQIGQTSPELNLGTYNRTTSKLRGDTIEINASDGVLIDTTNYNVEIQGNTIILGTTNNISIQGSNIDIGTTGTFNNINIGNDYSIMNINSGINGYIYMDYINQLGF